MNKEKLHGSDEDIDDRACWKRRSKLEKKLLLTLASLIGLFIGILVYSTTKPKPTPPEICMTAACLTAASQIVNHIDPEVDPCEDFFKFACGKFIEQIHGDMKATSVMELEERVQRQLTEIIKEPIKEDDHYFVRTQKELFHTCMNESAIEEETLPRFQEILEELDGWPVVVGYTWKVKRFDWKDMMMMLRQRGFPSMMILSVYVVVDPGDETKNIVKISPPYVNKIKEEHKELYKKFMADVAVMFGADRTLAEIEMEKVMDFMDNLNRISEKNEWKWENETESEKKSVYVSNNRFTISEFQNRNEEYNTEINWIDFLNGQLEPTTISQDSYVIFPKSEYLDEFFKLLHKTKRRIQANYMIWRIIEDLIPYFSKELKERKANYTCITEDEGTSKDRFKFCKKEISRIFYPRPTDILYVRKYMPAEKREKVQELFGNVKYEFTTLLSKTSWMDDETKERALEKADALVEYVGAPGDYFNDTTFEMFENATAIEAQEDHGNGTYLEMLLTLAKFQLDAMYSEIDLPTNYTQIDMIYGFLTRVNAMYSLEHNKIILPAAILQGVFYDEDRPMYLNYGAIGSIIGHELTHGFCEEGSKYDKDGNEYEMWTEATKQSYQDVTRCIIEDAEDFDVEDTDSKINGTLTLEENIADYTGLKVSYEAYKKWVEENGEEPKLPGIDYTPNQLFWISATAYECYKLNVDKLEVSLKKDSHAHNSFRSTGPLRNNPNFAEDFNCPVDSNMNPEEKCQIF